MMSTELASTLNVRKELAGIRKEYNAAIEKSEKLSEAKLISMQSMLYSILLSIEHTNSREKERQSREAVHLFNTISAELKTLQFDRQAKIPC